MREELPGAIGELGRGKAPGSGGAGKVGSQLAVVALAVALAAGPLRGGEVVDRIVATAGQHVVTLSAVERSLKLEACIEGRPIDHSREARRLTVDRLINQALIRREIAISRYEAPPMAEAEAEIERLYKSRYANPERRNEELARYGIDEDLLKKQVLWAITLYRFTEFRFGSGIQVTDEELAKYYREEFEKSLRAGEKGKEAPMPALDAVRGTIQKIVANLKTNALLAQWIELTRSQMKIRYFEEALQ